MISDRSSTLWISGDASGEGFLLAFGVAEGFVIGNQ